MRSALLAPVLAAFAASPVYLPVAPGWTAPESPDHRASIDTKVSRTGRASLLIASSRASTGAFAVRQSVKADRYRGRRIRLSGWVRPDASPDGAGLWLRVDMSNGDYILDGMLGLSGQDLATAKKSGWVRVDLVADIPADALGFAFGVRMRGEGRIWADDLSVGPVERSVRTNTIERRRLPAAAREAGIRELHAQYDGAPAAPVNAGFEQR